jgi:hypothetical protein
MQATFVPTRTNSPKTPGAACLVKEPAWLTGPHVLFEVNANSLWQATRILGDEFSAMGLAVALGIPKPMVAQGLASMAEGNWIALIPEGGHREQKHGPWYEPRAKWEQLRAAKSGVAVLSL